MKLPALPGIDAESKFRDPNKSEHDWQQTR